MKAAFHTLGCKVNQYETEALKENFRAAGYDIVDENDKADVYVINTCTVTGLADRKSRQYIRRMKKQCPESCIAVTGCYAQVGSEEIMKIPGVNIVAGTNEKHNLLRYIEEYKAAPQSAPHRYIKKYDELGEYEETGTITSMESRTRAYIKIEEGCNRFCSYCIIPYARGPVRSRSTAEIVEEARQLVENGFREIILTGINTALYGADSADGSGTCGLKLHVLLEQLDALDGDFRIRLSSLEPTVIDAEYVKKVIASKRLCHSMHLSLQSGSDNILRAMNRKYDRQGYLDIVKVLRDFDPYYGISTDIIAGFPGETEEDLAGSVKMTEEAEFCKTHVFKYSRRKGTKAAEMDGQIDPSIKKQRSAVLIDAAEEAERKFCVKNIGRTERVLFEEDGSDGKYMTGYAGNYIRIYADLDREALGEMRDVKLTKIYKDGIYGILLP